ncbi:hypothetical protein GGU11DRAFT_749679 [Lentinula aff. detonsa]|nr:hypothetical protein GGU11DRAFT_749679 [Lentinula aff. detonsa]
MRITAATSSGSFLVSKSPYNSQTPFPRLLDQTIVNLPRPNWSLTRISADPDQYNGKEAMGHAIGKLTLNLKNDKDHHGVFCENQEIFAAQTVIQDMTLAKMSCVVYKQEEEKKSRKSTFALPDLVYGRIWTDEAIAQAMRDHRDNEARKKAEKDLGAKKRETKRSLKAGIERRWKEIKETHRNELEVHKECCKKLREDGMRVKDLPPKPKHISRKDLTSQILEEIEGEAVVSEGDDEMDEESNSSDSDDSDSMSLCNIFPLAQGLYFCDICFL